MNANTNFSVWVDDSVVTNSTQDLTTFKADGQRQSGFSSGNVASSIRVNSALRQANLIACALVDVISNNYSGISYTPNLQSTRSYMGDAINAWLTNLIQNTTVTNATNATNVSITNNDTSGNANVEFSIGSGSYSKTINNVENATNATNDSDGNEISSTYLNTNTNSTVTLVFTYSSGTTSTYTVYIK